MQSALRTHSCSLDLDHLPVIAKMPCSLQPSVSTPFLSTPTDSSYAPDDNVSSIGSRPHSSAETISPTPSQEPQPPQQPSQAKQRPAARTTVTQSWKWEFCSAILLLISVAAIPATLYPHDGQPLPQWPFSISINALLSIYSLVLRACIAFLVTSCIGQLQWSWYLEARPLKDVVLFHEAANGILGCVRWLWINRLRQPVTALAAMISIVALAIDPFIQQLVHAADCSKTLSNDLPATIPRTNYLNLGSGVDSSGTSFLPTILDGLNKFQNLTDFECLTGNCTFRNTYASLAFCSQCSDRSSEVVLDEQCTVQSFDKQCTVEFFGEFCSVEATTVDQGPCNLVEGDRKTKLRNLTTSWPPFAVNFYYDPSLDVSVTNPAPTVFSIQAKGQYFNVSSSDQVPRGLQFGAILGYSDSAIVREDPTNSYAPLRACDDSATNDTWRCRGFGAAECVLQPCVRTYSCSIEAGRINETIVEESSLDQIWGFWDPFLGDSNLLHAPLLGLLDLHCVTDADRRNLIENGYDVDNAGRWLSYNTTLNASNPVNTSSPFPESLLANDCLYIINPNFIEAFWVETLWPFLIGNVTRNLPELQSRAFGYVFEGREKLLQLYNSGNVSMESIRDTFTNLAQALTLWVRSNGDPRHSRRAEGDVLHYAVCVRVTWAWITLPATLVALALAMLALTVATTARRAVPMWKLFSLAVLLCGPAGDNWVDQGLLAANISKEGKASSWDDNSVDGMSKLASKIPVQLFEQDGKFQLRQVGVRSKEV